MKNEKTGIGKKTKGKKPKCALSKKQTSCVKKTGCDWVNDECVTLKTKRTNKATTSPKTPDKSKSISPKKKKMTCEWVSVKDLTQKDKILLSQQTKSALKLTKSPYKQKTLKQRKQRVFEKKLDQIRKGSALSDKVRREKPLASKQTKGLTGRKTGASDVDNYNNNLINNDIINKSHKKPLKKLLSPLMRDIKEATEYVSKTLKSKKSPKKSKMSLSSPPSSRSAEKLQKRKSPKKMTNLVLYKPPSKLAAIGPLGKAEPHSFGQATTSPRHKMTRKGTDRREINRTKRIDLIAGKKPGANFSQRFASLQLSKPFSVEPYEQTKLQKQKQLTKKQLLNYQRFSPKVRYPVSPYFDRESRLQYDSQLIKRDTKRELEKRRIAKQKRIHNNDLLSKLMDIPANESKKLASHPYGRKRQDSPRTFYELENVVRNNKIVKGIDDIVEFKNMPIRSGRISNYSFENPRGRYKDVDESIQKYLNPRLEEDNPALNFKIANTLTKKRTLDFFAEDPSQLIIPTSIKKKGLHKKKDYSRDYTNSFDKEHSHQQEGLILEIPDHDNFVNYDSDAQKKRWHARKSHDILNGQRLENDPSMNEKFSKLFNTVMQEKKKKSYQI